MRAIHIFTCVLMLLAIVNADPEEEEGITIYISEDAEVIYDCPGQAAEQCASENGFCVENGGHCNGTFNIIHNSCTDHCSCCLPDNQAGTALTSGETDEKVVPDECYSRDQVPCSDFPNGENFPHPEHCYQFFKCEWGSVVTKTCNYGKLYNHRTGWCEYDMEEDDCMCPMKEECPDGFIMVEGSNKCFKFFNDEERTWNKAKTKCEEEGLQIAEPDDAIAATLRKQLLNTYGNGGAWLGARGDGSNYVWQRKGTDLTSYSDLLRPGLEGTNILRTHCLGLVVTQGAWNRYPERPYGSRACSRDYYTLCEKAQGGRTKKAVGGSQSSHQSRFQ